MDTKPKETCPLRKCSIEDGKLLYHALIVEHNSKGSSRWINFGAYACTLIVCQYDVYEAVKKVNSVWSVPNGIRGSYVWDHKSQDIVTGKVPNEELPLLINDPNYGVFVRWILSLGE